MILHLCFLRVEDMYGQNGNSIKEYRIERITKMNNWYFIYASRNDSTRPEQESIRASYI